MASNRQSSRKGRVLVTGASSGIGEALAKCFANAGYDLVLVARSEDKLLALADSLGQEFAGQYEVAPADLSAANTALTLAQNLQSRGLDIEILVNCAGVLEHGRFTELSGDTQQKLIDLNISGLTAMIHSFLPPMIAQGRGRILNVASIAAFQPIPSLATYAATKAYVLSLTESLAEELSGSGITVTALCPGVTQTNMLASAQAKSQSLNLPDVMLADAGSVARAGMQACLNGDVICVPGLLNKGMTLTSRITPKWLVRRVSGLLGRMSLRE